MYRIRTVDDAQQRLFKTVVVHDGIPVYITNVHGAQEVSGKSLVDGKNIRFHLNPSSTMPPKLGYVNYEGYAIFVKRRPVRRVRQGVCAENIIVPVGSREALLQTRAFGNMLVNTYPSIQKCIERVHGGKFNSEAFSKSFCIHQGKHLVYEEEVVGEWDTSGKLTLKERFKCLQELLDAHSK